MDDAYYRRKLVAGICVIILFLILLIGEAMRDKTLGRWAFAWFAVALSAFGMIMMLLVLLFGYGASAKNLDGRYDNAPFHEWYENQHNARGQWCCNEADGHPYYDDYALNADGSVTAELNGQKYRIEPDQVLTGANPTGHAVWWYTEGYSGINTWCFAVGQAG